MQPMRELGRTGLSVSPLGFGAWQIGGAYTLGGQAAGIPEGSDSGPALVGRALALGVNFFDTARHYGLSETVLGECFAGLAAKPVVASKCGIAPDGRRDLRPETVRAAVAESGRQLGVSRVDIYLATIAVYDDAAAKAGETLMALREEGRVRAWGFSLNRPEDALRLLDAGTPDVLEVPYNLFDVRFGPVLARCAEQGVGVAVKSPLNKGLLTGKYRPGARFALDDARSVYLTPERLAARDAWIEAFLTEFGLPREGLRETALRFVLSAPGVSAAALGCRNVSQLEQNLALRDDPLDNDLAEAIRSFSKARSSLLGDLHA